MIRINRVIRLEAAWINEECWGNMGQPIKVYC